ncbi:hypothetical protein BX659_14116 [Orenia metallireducens]|uniref:Uncharacterized protein n=1 Tax=Orenia metallireducens TaxID=1413210 RepID=A0A285IFA4_9FIRM|nr:DUF4912 domain-containing protein [Orenia metallireducens]PRX18825.1 hypothetical protein BX659_14116 [Orenia metallireducens]SNY46467.1 hypothetical protein SAMN06265827_14216 [Orenia metallireducens]
MSKMQEVNLNQLNNKEVLSSPQTSELAQKKMADNEPNQDNVNQYQIPDSYKENKLVLQVKNPKTAHLYWEYNMDKIDEICHQAGYKGLGDSPLVLRVYNLSLGDNYNVYYDINITSDNDSWYLNDLTPANTYEVKLGVLDKFGNIHTVLESNRVSMPTNKISDLLDEEWMTVKETMDIIYLLSGVLARGQEGLSSAELIKKELRKISEELELDLYSLEERISSLELFNLGELEGSAELLKGSAEILKVLGR